MTSQAAIPSSRWIRLYKHEIPSGVEADRILHRHRSLHARERARIWRDTDISTAVWRWTTHQRPQGHDGYLGSLDLPRGRERYPRRTGTFDGAFTITPAAANNPVRLTDAKIQEVLTNQINARRLPGPGPNRVYVVFFPSGKEFSAPTSNCAWHSSFRYPGSAAAAANNAFYAAIPFAARGCFFGWPMLDRVTFPVSHEVIETITDPVQGSAFGQTYAVTEHYSLAVGGCVP